jgi:hypothetical protein
MGVFFQRSYAQSFFGAEIQPKSWFSAVTWFSLWFFVGFLLSLQPYTVKKLQSLNLLFSCMFRIGRKFVHVGAEKINTLY